MGMQSEVNISFYRGSRVLEPLSAVFGLDCAKLNLLLCQCLSVFSAWFYFFKIPPMTSPKQVRLLFPPAIGLAICYFCNGNAILHIIFLSALCYVIMLKAPAECVHKIVFPVCMVYLEFGHGYRTYVYLRYGVLLPNLYTYTGSLMLLVQKLVALSFSLHDGGGKKVQLSSRQRKELLSEAPTFIEYISYIFHFQTIMTGPFVFFSEFKAFIYGTNFPTNREINPVTVVIDKLAFALTCLVLATVFGGYYPPEIFNDPDVMALPLWRWWAMLCLVIFIQRLIFYYHWYTADAICNLSGLGFNGFSPDGEPRWDLVSNVDVWGVETARSYKEQLDAWNVSTVHWLRFIVYDRVPKRQGGIYVSLMSAVWHGFFIGYYMSYLSGALIFLGAQSVRRYIRPFFQRTIWLPRLYDAITIVATHLAAVHVILPFVTCLLNPGLAVFRRVYFIFHLMSLFAIFVLPAIVPVSAQTEDGEACTTDEMDEKHE